MNEGDEGSKPEGSKPAGRKLPLSRATQHGELFDRVADAEYMLAVFRRELPALADAEIRVTDCVAKPTRSRKAIRAGKFEVVYKVGIEVGGGPRNEYVLFGIAPAAPELLDSELKEQRCMLRGHAWAKPFRDVGLYLEDLRLALLLFPLDPALPGLAEMTGSEGARLLAASLPECAAGSRIERIDCTLAHYKPFKRAVLRIRVALRAPLNGAHERIVYAKFFADEQGAIAFRNLAALRSAAQGATSLRLPEPLGYDAQRRMLVMSEAPGQRTLTEWVGCIESGEPLPAGVDLARMKRCALVAVSSLLELQRSGVRPDETRVFQDELSRVKKDCALLLDEVRKTQPDLAACVDSLLQRLEALTPESERLVPAHGCYRHDQMIGDEVSLTPIDWDGFSLANPALDAAIFVARMRREPRRRPGAAQELEEVAATFRDAFLESQPELARDLDLYEGLLLTEQLLRAFRRPGDGEETAREVRLLASASAGLLDRVEGNGALPAGRTNGAPSLPEPPVPASRRKELPLSTAPEKRDLFGRVADPEQMLAVLRRVLPALADGSIRVTSCKAKPCKSRRSIRQGRLEVVYTVAIEVGGQLREFTLLGVTPAPPELLGTQLKERCYGLRGHPWATPFRELATYVEENQQALLLFPMDPALPGLAEATGSEGARLFAASLPECRAGAEIVGFECDLIRYKPLDRAVVKMRATLRSPMGEHRRTAYAKFFADDQGAVHFRDLTALWSATRDATSLRLPEPLGYDPARRMLVMGEAPGDRDLARWIKCLERGDPLPDGVSPARLERCARIVAEALQELQASGVRPELRRTFLRELARVKGDRDLLLHDLRKHQPELTAGADALIDRLETLAPAEERLVPAHGCYRHKQMIGDEHSLTFIDWDGFSMASPALDAATFLGRLCREPRRRPGTTAQLERMGSVFRSAFLEQQPHLARDLALYEGLVLTEQMLRAFRRPGDGADTLLEIRLLADAAAGMLDRVEGATAAILETPRPSASNGSPAESIAVRIAVPPAAPIP
jgi:aminoglycoside phosphotransferase (APT) family kinase protein